jgi:hypothetical protein
MTAECVISRSLVQAIAYLRTTVEQYETLAEENRSGLV